MNISTKAVKILCFGDSNTWGYIPGTGERYPVNIRWTGILQNKLGNNYWVVEEGLNGRTTVIDDPKKPYRNGKEYLLPCILSTNPIDLVILFLGTNDLKERLNRTPNQIANGAFELVQLINKVGQNRNGSPPQIILVSPPIINETVPGVKKNYLGAEEKSKRLASLYEKVANKTNSIFVNSALFADPSEVDGYHFNKQAHKKVAETLYNKIKNI